MTDDDLLVRLIRELDALYVAAMVSDDPVAWACYEFRKSALDRLMARVERTERLAS